MLICCKDVYLSFCCTEKVESLAIVVIDLKFGNRVLRAGRGCRLVPASVRILDRHGRVHVESGVEHSVVAPFLVHSSCVEGEVELEVILYSSLLYCYTSAEFLTACSGVETGGFLVVCRCVV